MALGGRRSVGGALWRLARCLWWDWERRGGCSAAVVIDKKHLLISLSRAAAAGQDPAPLVQTTIVCCECECVSV